MRVGIFDIVQYDCPVVWLTEHVKDSNILVVGANVAEIRKGYEKIYVVVLGDSDTVSKALEKLGSIKCVKSYEILQKRSRYAKIGMLIRKTNTMEAVVDYDAMPLAIWVAINGFERWTLGFHTAKQLREFIKTVSERDYIEKYKLVELPEYILSVNYFNMFSQLGENLDRITSKQVELLASAVKLGYYEWPRKINISLLAKKLGTSRVAIAKTLRRAEKNVLEMFLKLLESESRTGSKLG